MVQARKSLRRGPRENCCKPCVCQTDGKAVTFRAGHEQDVGSDLPVILARVVEPRDFPPLAQVLGAERFLAARPMLALLATIDIPRTPGALQLDAIAVLDAYRGQGLLQRLLSHIEADFSARQPAPEHVQILLMRENLRALSAYEKAGYRVATETNSDDPIIPTLVPGTGRMLLTKAL